METIIDLEIQIQFKNVYIPVRACREAFWFKMVWKHSGHSQTNEEQ